MAKVTPCSLITAPSNVAMIFSFPEYIYFKRIPASKT
nr:MAG TPA: hypothetical protein [Caudoviricetes sp.]DAY38172.1 MAG TPA: hypothetical protein [Caudoviricetes sp.]